MSPGHRSSEMVVVQEPYQAYPAMPQENYAPGLSLAQLITIMRSYWRLSAAIAGGTLVATLLVLLVLPKAYTAKATLIYDYDNRDPLAGEQIPIGLMHNYVETQVELMTSPVVLNAVVDHLGLTTDKEYAGGFSGDASALRDYDEKKLSTSIVVDEGRGGQLLYVTVTNKTAARAAEIANAVADVYLDLDQKRMTDPATERATRYAAQLAELRSKVAAAQAKVTEFRQRNGLTDVTAANSDVDMQGFAELQQRLIEAQNARRNAEAKAAGERSVSDEALASKTVETLKDKLGASEAELAQLRNTLGPQHPKILELEAQIATMRRSLDAELRTLAANNEQRLRTSRDLEGKYSGALNAQRQKLLAIRQLQDEGGKLLLELESAQSVYKRALDGYDQIMFASSSKHTNVTLVDRAVPPSKPSKPSKIKLLMLGIAAGVFLGLLAPLGYELFINRRIRHRDDLERELGIPVLAELGMLGAARGNA